MKQLALLILVFISVNLTAQKDYKWKGEIKPSPAIPAEFAEDDAVMIYQNIIRGVSWENAGILFTEKVEQRIKIQTQNGLEKFSRIVIPKRRFQTIKVLDARTIKKNGQVVNISSDKIKKIDLVDEKDLFQTSDFRLFSIGGVEVGDEIEIVYLIEGYSRVQGNVYLHSYLPILKSSFEVTINKELMVIKKEYNDFPNLKIFNGNTTLTFSAVMKNTQGWYDQRNSIEALDLPYFTYEIAPRIVKTSWKSFLAEFDQELLYYTMRKRKAWNDFIENKILGGKTDLSEIEKLKIIHEYINANVKIVNLKDEEQSAGVFYYLKEGRADYMAMLKIYKAVFETLESDFYIGVAKARFLGPLDLKFPSDVQVSDVIYAVEKEGKYFIFIPKSSNRTYELNEVSIDIAGTDVAIFSKKRKDVLSLTFPLSPAKDNRRTRQIQMQVDVDKNQLNAKVKEVFTGAYSTDYRHYFNISKENGKLKEIFEEALKQNHEKAVLKSIEASELNHNYPYDYTLNYEYSIDNSITELEKGVHKISIEDWLNHNLLYVDAKNRSLDFYPYYQKYDNYTYFLMFDKEIELINKENIDMIVKTKYGEYMVRVDQVKPNMLRLISKYSITSSKIPSTEVDTLEEMNEATEEADTEGIIIKFK